jgi:hypothetical protein
MAKSGSTDDGSGFSEDFSGPRCSLRAGRKIQGRSAAVGAGGQWRECCVLVPSGHKWSAVCCSDDDGNDDGRHKGNGTGNAKTDGTEDK